VTDRKTELIREEDQAWSELHALLGRLTPEQMTRPGLTPDWSVKDLKGHLASWWAEAKLELERMRFGTFRLERVDLDTINRQFYEANRDLDLAIIRAELHAARNKALEALWNLDEVTPHAEEWFLESGPLHYREHLPDLEGFVKETAG
jgi:Mycothiol maleylpyruvate isomerase N-terminal domain